MNVKLPPKKWIVTVAAVTSLATATLGAYVWKEESRPPILEIYVFNLKSGRSYFVRTPDDQRILIDGGANSEIIARLSSILPFYTRRIDTLIATNDDGKNVSGLIDVLNRYEVREVVLPRTTSKALGFGTSTERIYETFLETAKSKNISPVLLSQGDYFVLGQGVGFETLFPASTDSFVYSKASGPELIFNIKYGSTTISFLASSSKKVQNYLSTETFTSRSDVVVLSTSAAAANLSAGLINKLRPTYLVYSKSASRVAPKQTSKPKKPNIDPLDYMQSGDRFNIRDSKQMLITSNGSILKVVTDP